MEILQLLLRMGGALDNFGRAGERVGDCAPVTLVQGSLDFGEVFDVDFDVHFVLFLVVESLLWGELVRRCGIQREQLEMASNC